MVTTVFGENATYTNFFNQSPYMVYISIDKVSGTRQNTTVTGSSADMSLANQVIYGTAGKIPHTTDFTVEFSFPFDLRVNSFTCGGQFAWEAYMALNKFYLYAQNSSGQWVLLGGATGKASSTWTENVTCSGSTLFYAKKFKINVGTTTTSFNWAGYFTGFTANATSRQSTVLVSDMTSKEYTITTPKYLQSTTMFTTANVTQVGTGVSINNTTHMASGFVKYTNANNTGSYLKYNSGQAFNPGSSDFEVQYAFRLPSNATGGIMTGTDNNYYHFDTKWGPFYRYPGLRITVTRSGIKVELHNEVIVMVNLYYPFPRTAKFYTADISYNFDTSKTYIINLKKVGTKYTTTLTDTSNSFTRTYSATSSEVINEHNKLIGANYGSGVTSTAFDGQIDLFNSWIKIKGNYWWVNKQVLESGMIPQTYSLVQPKYLNSSERFTPIDVEQVGTSVIIDNNTGRVSNFTNTSYLKLTKKFAPTTNWECVMCVQPHSTATSQNNSWYSMNNACVLGIPNGYYGWWDHGITIVYVKSPNVGLFVTTKSCLVTLNNSTADGGSTNISTYVNNNLSLSSSTFYDFKITFNGGNTYTVSYKPHSSSTYTQLTTISSTKTVGESTINIGYTYQGIMGDGYIGVRQAYFNGVIDLANSYIKVNNQYWWQNKQVIQSGKILQYYDIMRHT